MIANDDPRQRGRFPVSRVVLAWLRAACLLASPLVAAGAALATPAAPVTAQLAPVPVDSGASRPRYYVALYGWLAGIKGETGVRDLAADVDVSFDELLSHLRFAAMGTFEADFGKWRGLIDAMYISVRVDRSRSIRPVNLELTSTFKTLIAQAFGGYTFVASREVAVDALLGARIWSVDATLNIAGDLRERERSSSPTWGDALGGLRVRWSPSNLWTITAAAYSGVGDSESTVGLMTTVGYEVSRHWAVFGSYRYLHEDYRRGDYFFDGQLAGPVIGVAYWW